MLVPGIRKISCGSLGNSGSHQVLYSMYSPQLDLALLEGGAWSAFWAFYMGGCVMPSLSFFLSPAALVS